jgi:hypothetical protein
MATKKNNTGITGQLLNFKYDAHHFIPRKNRANFVFLTTLEKSMVRWQNARIK